jgi:hypothetical protein
MHEVVGPGRLFRLLLVTAAILLSAFTAIFIIIIIAA